MSTVPKCFALVNRDADVRRESTSGGAFTALASAFIRQGGIVCGAMFADDVRSLSHQCIETLDGLALLRKSKYVESDVSIALKRCREFLRVGRKVFFVGSHCQVAALRKVCGESANLLTADLVCHGVPSKKCWCSYLSYVESRLGGKIVSVNFRNKRSGWNRSQTELMADNGKYWCHISSNDPYMYAFYRGYSLRETCLHCSDLKRHRPGDLTLGDCWHVGKYCRDMDDNGGTSLLLVNSPKGEAFLRVATDVNRVEIRPYPYEKAEENNAALSRPALVDPKARADFEHKFAKGNDDSWGGIVPIKDRMRARLVYMVKGILCGLGMPI